MVCHPKLITTADSKGAFPHFVIPAIVQSAYIKPGGNCYEVPREGQRFLGNDITAAAVKFSQNKSKSSQDHVHGERRDSCRLGLSSVKHVSSG